MTTPLVRMTDALDGLSVGDAFGQQYFYVNPIEKWIDQRAVPASPWAYTDDTEMALGIAQVLREHGHIEQAELARVFAQRYALNPNRGYGAMAQNILEAIGEGRDWKRVSSSAFGGQGSMGNGGAMRVAPVGAYFADDLDQVAKEAALSAEVTHYHPEGRAGAIAIAVACAWAVDWAKSRSDPSTLFEWVLDYTPESDTRRGIEQARTMELDLSPISASSFLGNGSQITAPDTVPFTLWCAAKHPDDYKEAMWTTLTGLGDIDTNCAIVGGIVALSAGHESIPEKWIRAREQLQLTV